MSMHLRYELTVETLTSLLTRVFMELYAFPDVGEPHKSHAG